MLKMPEVPDSQAIQLSSGIRIVQISEIETKEPRVTSVFIIPPALMTYLSDVSLEELISERRRLSEVRSRIVREMLSDRSREQILGKLLNEVRTRMVFLQKLILVRTGDIYLNPTDISKATGRILETVRHLGQMQEQPGNQQQKRTAEETCAMVQEDLNRLLEGRQLLSDIISNMRLKKEELESALSEIESRYVVGLITEGEYSRKKKSLATELERTEGDIGILEYYKELTRPMFAKVRELERRIKELEENEALLGLRHQIGEYAEGKYEEEKQRISTEKAELDSHLSTTRDQSRKEAEELKGLVERLIDGDMIEPTLASSLIGETSES